MLCPGLHSVKKKKSFGIVCVIILIAYAVKV